MAIRNFSWVIENQLAGMAFPASRGDYEGDLKELRDKGVDALVSLTRTAIPDDAIKAAGFNYLRIPVDDFDAPSFRQIQQFVDFVRANLLEKKPVCVHCTAGLGRTGTMIACYLVSLGMSAFEAIQEVRKLRPGSIETLRQEQAVEAYEMHLKHS